MEDRKPPELLAASAEQGEDQDNAEARLGEYFGKMPADASVGIYEVDPDNARKTSFLFPLPAGELPAPAELFAEILDNCGPGTYEAFAQEKSGKIICKQRFSVGSMREQRRPLVPNLRGRRDSEAAAQPAQPSQPTAPTIPAELATILQNQQRLLETIADRLTQQPAESQRSVIDIARELKELQGLFAPQQPAPSQSVTEMIKDFLTIRDSLREDSEGDSSPFAAAIKHLAPAITNAVDKLAEGRESERAASLSRAAEAGRAEPGAPQTDVPQNGYAAMLSRYLSPLVEMAEAKEQPERAAQWVLQTLAQQPPAIADAVLDFLDDQESVRKLVAIEPKFTPHTEWLEAVITAVMQALDAQEAAKESDEQQQAAATKETETSANDGAPASSPSG